MFCLQSHTEQQLNWWLLSDGGSLGWTPIFVRERRSGRMATHQNPAIFVEFVVLGESKTMHSIHSTKFAVRKFHIRRKSKVARMASLCKTQKHGDDMSKVFRSIPDVRDGGGASSFLCLGFRTSRCFAVLPLMVGQNRSQMPSTGAA